MKKKIEWHKSEFSIVRKEKVHLYLGWKYGMCEYLRNITFVKNTEYVYS